MLGILFSSQFLNADYNTYFMESTKQVLQGVTRFLMVLSFTSKRLATVIQFDTEA